MTTATWLRSAARNPQGQFLGIVQLAPLTKGPKGQFAAAAGEQCESKWCAQQRDSPPTPVLY